MSDFIKLDKPEKDKIIRKMYTPKEVVGKIHDYFNYFMQNDLTMSERYLLQGFCNWLVWEFKDD